MNKNDTLITTRQDINILLNKDIPSIIKKLKNIVIYIDNILDTGEHDDSKNSLRTYMAESRYNL